MTANHFISALLAGLLFSLPTYSDNFDKKPDKSAVIPIVQDNSHVNIEMVELPIDILMGKYEVTQGQWQAIMGNNPSFFLNCGNNCPVEQVSWDDIQDFIHRLNSQTGAKYRLPSEDEWFQACQAGSNNINNCGSNSIDAIAWYKGNANTTTHAVGQKKANAWNLYDMSGNIWEWTSGCWQGNCPTGCNEGTCPTRVARGGSWDDFPNYLRSTYRFWNDTPHRYNTIGFRLVQDH